MFLQEVVETTIPEGLINTALGMGTVFCVLVLISFIIYLLRFVPGWFDRNKKTETVQSVNTVKQAAPQRMVSKSAVQATPAASDDTQLIAVLAAAVAAQMESETGIPTAADGLVIRSIKKRTFTN